MYIFVNFYKCMSASVVRIQPIGASNQHYNSNLKCHVVFKQGDAAVVGGKHIPFNYFKKWIWKRLTIGKVYLINTRVLLHTHAHLRQLNCSLKLHWQSGFSNNCGYFSAQSSARQRTSIKMRHTFLIIHNAIIIIPAVVVKRGNHLWGIFIATLNLFKVKIIYYHFP